MADIPGCAVGAWAASDENLPDMPCCPVQIDSYMWTRRSWPLRKDSSFARERQRHNLSHLCAKDAPTFDDVHTILQRDEWPHMAAVGDGCGCRPKPQRASLRWTPPAGCPAINMSHVCEALGSRRLLFVGDSVVQQAAAVTMGRIAFEASRLADESSRRVLRDCSRRMAFGHSDTLIDEPLGTGLNRGKPWHVWVREGGLEDGDVLVLSAGAHVYGGATFRRLLRTLAAQLQQHAPSTRPRLTVLWKTQQPGGCGHAPLERSPANDLGTPGYWARYPGSRQPLTPACKVWRDDASNTTACHRSASGALLFNWPDLEAYDEMALSFWRGTSHPRVGTLDLRPLHTRVDAHPPSDCLHMCVGRAGPLDTLVPTQLYHALMKTLMKTREQASKPRSTASTAK